MEFPNPFSRIFLVGLIPLVRAYSVFETTCSAPSPQSEFMFVSAPDTRGTLDILWSSLFTIFACTWALQHPSVPKQRNRCNPGLQADIELMVETWTLSTGRIIITLFAPEFIISKACENLIKAREVQEKMREYIDQDRVLWTLRHSYYAKMRGFAIRSQPLLVASNLENPDNSPRERTLHCLSAQQVYELRHTGVIESLPNIGVEEIKDKSKSDTFSKTIAIGQILWTIVQIIVRAVKKLPVSPLEIAVVAFAVCAVITYGLYLYKPQRVFTPMAIYDYIGQEETLDGILDACYKEALEKKNQVSPESENTATHPASEITTAGPNTEDKKPETTVAAADPQSKRKSGTVWSWMAGSIGATVFGGVHILAWNFAFPTKIELIFWRCASVYTAAFPFSMLIAIGIFVILDIFHSDDRTKEIVMMSLMAFFVCLYVVARLFILVEMFRTLFFLPAGSFVSTWSSNIPHVG